jgi:putative thioredoxin
LSKFLPTAADKEAEAAAGLEGEGKIDEAKAVYEAILKSDPNHAQALLGMARLAMISGDNTAALEHLDRISVVADERKEAERLIARINLQAGGAQNEAALREKIKAEPDNLDVRFELAQTLAGMERYEDALGEFVQIVKADRSFKDDGARKAMIQIFEVLGSDDPLTEKYRSELAAVLFR